MVHRDVEESLQLMLVEINAEDAVRARRLDHVRDELGADRDAWLILAILSRVAVVRHHDRDAGRARTLGRVDQEQRLEQILRRRVRRLNDEHVVAADVLIDPDEDLAIRKTGERELAQLDTDVTRHLLRERPIGRAAEELETVTRYRKAVHRTDREPGNGKRERDYLMGSIPYSPFPIPCLSSLPPVDSNHHSAVQSRMS